MSLKSSPRVGTMHLYRRVVIYLRLLANEFCLPSSGKYYCQRLGYNLLPPVTECIQHEGNFCLCWEINCQRVVIIWVINYLRVAYACLLAVTILVINYLRFAYSCLLAVINYNSEVVNIQFVTTYLFISLGILDIRYRHIFYIHKNIKIKLCKQFLYKCIL